MMNVHYIILHTDCLGKGNMSAYLIASVYKRTKKTIDSHIFQ